MYIDFGKLKIAVNFFPPEILVGFGLSNGEMFCEDCNDVHEMYIARLGLLFVVVNFMWFK